MLVAGWIGRCRAGDRPHAVGGPDDAGSISVPASGGLRLGMRLAKAVDHILADQSATGAPVAIIADGSDAAIEWSLGRLSVRLGADAWPQPSTKQLSNADRPQPRLVGPAPLR